MKKIDLIEKFNLGGEIVSENDLEVREIYNGIRRRMVEVKLRDNAVLTKHKANEPITVFCLAGQGFFAAGEDLEERQNLQAGDLITLESGIFHEVVAEPEIHLLVTKFKDL